MMAHVRLMFVNLWHGAFAHERIFGAYALFTLIRMAIAAGFSSPHTIVYALTLLLIASGTTLAGKTSSIWALRARLAIYPALMLFLFVHMRWVSPLINDGKMDEALWKLDSAILGGSLSVMMQGVVSPVLTELMSFCYMFFMIYLFVSILTWTLSGRAEAVAFYAGLFGIYGVGYFGYTLVPAIGPYLAHADKFSAPLEGWILTDFLAAAYPRGTNYTDIFPSIHCAASAFMLLFDARRNRSRFWICAAPCAGIWLSTIYLRYHYFVDVAAGCALAVIALWVANVVESREKKTLGSA
jgi:membrane-associated phospholipid phosphatase